ncbi:hypothetical protein WDW37_13075 [Bdellovibrionota bacterium FG-1]
MNRSLVGAFVLIGFAVFGAALQGCGKPQAAFNAESVISQSCAIATDQRQSFMAKVSGFPLQVNVDSTFSTAQISAIQSAVDQWNTLGQKQMGSDFFKLQVQTFSDSLRALDPSDCSAGADQPDLVPIMKESSGSHWKTLGFGDNIPAATLRCYGGEEVNRQIILVYTSIVDSAQMMSVMVHELGHAIGLDHSCTSDKSSDKYRACSGLPELHAYHVAVMYPALRARGASGSLPEVKEEIRANDVARTGCLYL